MRDNRLQPQDGQFSDPTIVFSQVSKSRPGAPGESASEPVGTSWLECFQCRPTMRDCAIPRRAVAMNKSAVHAPFGYSTTRQITLVHTNTPACKSLMTRT